MTEERRYNIVRVISSCAENVVDGVVYGGVLDAESLRRVIQIDSCATKWRPRQYVDDQLHVRQVYTGQNINR